MYVNISVPYDFRNKRLQIDYRLRERPPIITGEMITGANI